MDTEARRLKISAQGHTLSGWDMNSNVFRNPLQDVPPVFPPWTMAPGKEHTGIKDEKRQHHCYSDTNNLSGGDRQTCNRRQNVTAEEMY